MLPPNPTEEDVAHLARGEAGVRRALLTPWVATATEWWVRFGGTRADVEDGTSAAVSALVAKLEDVDAAMFRAALVAAVRRQLKRHARRRLLSRWMPGSGPELTDDSKVDLEPLPGKVGQSLDRLTLDQRMALILVELEGLTIPDASELLGLPAQSVDRLLDSARKKFADEVRQSGVPLPEIYEAYLARTHADPATVARLVSRILSQPDAPGRAPSDVDLRALSPFPRSAFKFLAGAGIGAGVLAAVMVSVFHGGEEAIPLAQSIDVLAEPDAGEEPALEPPLVPPLVPPPALPQATPDASAPPRASVTAVEVSGGLIADESERKLMTVGSELSDCYAKTQLGPGRKIVLSLFVVEGGVVRSVTAQPDDEASRALVSCVDPVLRRTELPLRASAAGARREFSIARVTLSP